MFYFSFFFVSFTLSLSCKLWVQALYHALPMDYVTVGKLQNKLDGEANQNTVRKLIDKMAQDGFVEATSNRRLGLFSCILLQCLFVL